MSRIDEVIADDLVDDLEQALADRDDAYEEVAEIREELETVQSKFNAAIELLVASGVVEDKAKITESDLRWALLKFGSK